MRKRNDVSINGQGGGGEALPILTEDSVIIPFFEKPLLKKGA